ncbi:latexin isoform X1 [Acipenser ruthenus]|uniref:latexin isoform X1 n=2 Tax=Acipenser ruthenus TaxID=7906 RepID=UPI00145AA772|nr:latexin isoform X1 [Acipenser ruthenus]
MRWTLWIVLGLFPLVDGHPTLKTDQNSLETADAALNHQNGSLNSVLHLDDTEKAALETTRDDPAFPMKELNTSHYPATRAAKVAQHYLNYHHGSPSKWFMVHAVKKASSEDIPEVGKKYHIQFSVQEQATKEIVGNCTAEILFRQTEVQSAPEVNCTCDDLLKIKTSDADHALYHHIKHQPEPMAGMDIPDSQGNIPKEMEPLWYLGGIGASFIMWQQSNESTLYNMAHVHSVKQLNSENDLLAFEYVVLLHDMVSQEIIHWHMQVAWNPTQGVKVTQCHLLPKGTMKQPSAEKHKI